MGVAHRLNPGMLLGDSSEKRSLPASKNVVFEQRVKKFDQLSYHGNQGYFSAFPTGSKALIKRLNVTLCWLVRGGDVQDVFRRNEAAIPHNRRTIENVSYYGRLSAWCDSTNPA
jgi:hypothetical protein